jgi:predicted transcriptional regulator
VATLFSVRLDDHASRQVARLARAQRRTRSDVVREAVGQYVARQQESARPWDQWKDVIGIAKGLPADLSERTGEKVARLLQERHFGRYLGRGGRRR